MKPADGSIQSGEGGGGIFFLTISDYEGTLIG